MTIMDVVLYNGAVTVTGWKLCGWTGAMCFGIRWAVQAWHRRRSGSPEMPPSFWWISLVGALLTLAYFIFGDASNSVGILQNALPAVLAIYNICLDLRHPRAPAITPSA